MTQLAEHAYPTITPKVGDVRCEITGNKFSSLNAQ